MLPILLLALGGPCVFSQFPFAPQLCAFWTLGLCLTETALIKFDEPLCNQQSQPLLFKPPLIIIQAMHHPFWFPYTLPTSLLSLLNYLRVLCFLHDSYNRLLWAASGNQRHPMGKPILKPSFWSSFSPTSMPFLSLGSTPLTLPSGLSLAQVRLCTPHHGCPRFLEQSRPSPTFGGAFVLSWGHSKHRIYILSE